MNRKSLLVLIAIMVLAISAYYFFGQPQPRIQEQGAPLVQVNVPQLSAAEQEGETAYNQYCAACHGRDAAGQDGVAPSFVHLLYVPGHHGDAAFASAAVNGVRAHHWPFGDMPPVPDIATDDIARIVTYVRALQRANGIQ